MSLASSLRRHVLALVALSILGVFLAAFLPTTEFGLVWDDVSEVAQNPLLRGPLLDGLLIGQDGQMGGAAQDDSLLKPAHDSFRPIRYLSYRVDLALHGLSPRGLHAQNVAWAALAILLVFVLAREWLRSAAGALVIAAIFAFHPLHVEPVAYVSARSDLLAGVFALAAAALVVRAIRREPSHGLARFYAPAGMFFLLSLASKEANLALPLVLAIFAYSHCKLRTHLAPLVTMALLGAGWLVLRGQILHTSGSATPLPALRYLGSLFFQYVSVYLVPLDCSVVRPASEALPWVATLLLTALGLLLLVATHKAPSGLPARLLPCVAWAVLLFAPSALAATVFGTASDRYFYLPSLGLSLTLVEVAREAPPRARSAAQVLFAGWLTACLGATWMQIPTWQDDLTLYSHAVDTEPTSTRAHYGVGLALARRGACAEAIPRFEHAVILDASNTRAWTNLGVCQLRLGRLPAARAALQAGLRSCDGLYAPTWHNLAALEFATGDRLAACAAERRALTLQPNYGPAQRSFATYCAHLD